MPPGDIMLYLSSRVAVIDTCTLTSHTMILPGTMILWMSFLMMHPCMYNVDYVHVHACTVEHRYKEHLIPKHKIRYNHNFVIKELQWNTDITTGCKDRFVITL